MSIDLVGVSHSTKAKKGARNELHDINMHVENDQRVALLGTKTSGLPTIIDMICGATIPLHGHVSVTSNISWPIGEDGFTESDRSLVMNLRFIARLYEQDVHEYVARINEVADLGAYWNDKLSACTKEVKWRFAFALGVCLPFDIYIFESAESGDKSYTEKCNAVIQELGKHAGLLIVTNKGETAKQFCDTAFVLDDETLHYYQDMDAAIAHLDRLTEDGEGQAAEEEEEEEDDDDGLNMV